MASWQLWAALALLWFGMDPALRLGSAWNSSVLPAHDVEVVLRDGSRMKGDLSVDWRGDYTLHMDDGRVVRFRMEATSTLEFPPPKNRDASELLLARWRAHLPPLLLFGAALCLLMTTFARALHGGSNRQTKA